MSIHDAETEVVKIVKPTSNFRKAITEPVEKVRGYTREELYHLITAPVKAVTPYNTVPRGYDTCETLSIVLQWSGAYVFTWLLGIGFVRVLEVQQNDGHYAMVKTLDLNAHDTLYS